MHLEKDYIYHIYNQGNNNQTLFFNRNNYLYFLKKINTYILPYADIISWCLMPNHFHLMVYVKEVSLPTINLGASLRRAETSTQTKERTLNHSIGIMLMSYTKALNKQQNRTGKLFREQTKAECVTCFKGLKPSFIGNKINISIEEKEYPKILFNYIHLNPVKARIVSKTTDWEFSSAKDYKGLRNGKLINKKRAKEFISGIF